MKMEDPELLVRSVLGFLVIAILPFVIIVVAPFLTLFDGTPAMTSDLFASIDTGNIFENLVFLTALRLPIELFGYQSILIGISWYFIIIVAIFFISWFIGGLLSRSHKINLVYWGIGIAYIFLMTWIAASGVPPSNVPAYDAFVALDGLVFSLDVWFPLVMYTLVCLGGATLGTLVGRRFKGKKWKPECTMDAWQRGECDPFKPV